MGHVSVAREALGEFAELVSGATGVAKEIVIQYIMFSPREEFGDLSLALPSIGVKDPSKLPDEIKGVKYISLVKKEKIYYNAFLNEKEVFKRLFSDLERSFAVEKVERRRKVIVEHTSANPIHPLHIGHLRNAVLGDIVARMLRCRGHEVNTRFYVNDAGRQVAILVYGYLKLGKPSPPSGVKIDEWIGTIYSMTNVILEIREIKEKLNSAEGEERQELLKRLDELVSAAARLAEKDKEAFYRLADAINADPNPEGEIAEIIRKYESKSDDDIVKTVRTLVGYALQGFDESLKKLGISFDAFDFESDLLWNGAVSKVVNEALASRFVTRHKDTLALNVNAISADIRERLRIPKGLELPPLVLVRSDGTSLYTTRDIAYTLFKFSLGYDEVINVIAEQQSVPQMQLRAALYLMGHQKEAENLIHYSYAMVSLQGMRMSGRLGRYVSFDEVYSLVKREVEKVLEQKGGNREAVDDIVNAAIRYAIASVSASKQLSFNVSAVVNLEQNSGPYLQYTYARAYNILEKATDDMRVEEADLDYIKGDIRKLLIELVKFPEVAKKACDELRPEDLVSYLREVADLFNKLYNYERVLQEPDKGRRLTKLFIVKGVERVLYNGLTVLGIKPLKRM